jgi:hypothetical protein
LLLGNQPLFEPQYQLVNPAEFVLWRCRVWLADWCPRRSRDCCLACAGNFGGATKNGVLPAGHRRLLVD